MSLGTKLIRMNLAMCVLTNPQMNASSSTGKTGVKPKIMKSAIPHLFHTRLMSSRWSGENFLATYGLPSLYARA